MDKLRRVLSGNDVDEESGGIMSDVRESSSLSWETRIKGFIGCFVVGLILSILGTVAVFFHNYVMFGLLFSLGSVVSLMSTCFLMGPIKQIKKMFATTRLIATIIVVIMIVLTLMAAFWWHNGGLCLLFVLLQYIAMTWYSLSYIPYARDAVKKCFGACIGA